MFAVGRRLIRVTVLNAVERLLPARYELAYHLFLDRMMGRVEEELLRLDTIVEGREVALDIGANQGYYSYTLSRLFEKVIAFEPNPSVVTRLLRSGAGNVEVHNVALSSSTGELDLFVPVVDGVEQSGWASFNRNNLPDARDFRVLHVPVRPLDSFGLTTVSFIKIDVEGHEPAVLAGAVETLRRCRPVVLIEVKEENRDAVFRLFAELGYRPYRLRGGKLVPQGGGDDAGAGENYVFRPGRG
jgi:FkbM family methyltransferase